MSEISTQVAGLQEFGVIDVEKLKTMKNMIAKDATNEELELFAMYCNRVKLDPFSNQIHFIKRNGKPAFQTSIDGFRIVANRTGKYSGQTDVEYGPEIDFTFTITKWEGFGENKKKKQESFVKKVPSYAKVGVHRRGFDGPLYSTAYFEEYCPEPPNQTVWKKMPRVMLAKVAEAAALRKAFPNDLAGIYTDDEMQQDPQVQQAAKKPDLSPHQRLWQLFNTAMKNYSDEVKALSLEVVFGTGNPQMVEKIGKDLIEKLLPKFQNLVDKLKTEQNPEQLLKNVLSKLNEEKVATEGEIVKGNTVKQDEQRETTLIDEELDDEDRNVFETIPGDGDELKKD